MLLKVGWRRPLARLGPIFCNVRRRGGAGGLNLWDEHRNSRQQNTWAISLLISPAPRTNRAKFCLREVLSPTKLEIFQKLGSYTVRVSLPGLLELAIFGGVDA